MSDFFATPWTEARQAPPSMGFFKQEYWNGLPFPSPGDLPDPGIKPASPAWQADSLPSELPGKLLTYIQYYYIHANTLYMRVHKYTDICRYTTDIHT